MFTPCMMNGPRWPSTYKVSKYPGKEAGKRAGGPYVPAPPPPPSKRSGVQWKIAARTETGIREESTVDMEVSCKT